MRVFMSPKAAAYGLHCLFLASCTFLWFWIWSGCANPLNTLCFVGSGEGDHLQHYFAWQAFASSKALTLARPSFSNWTWPLDVPLIYGDPIILLAVILKPIQQLSASSFQYFSVASLLNFYLSYICGVLIARRLGLALFASCVLGFLLSTSGLAILRLMGHEALAMQGILLVALLFCVTRMNNAWNWGILLFIALGIHAYFVPMIFPLAIFTILTSSANNSAKFYSGKFFRSFVVLLVIVSCSLYFWGYLPNSMETNTGGDLWSANLAAMVDSQGLSFLIPPIEIHRPYQWEGYSYIGIGGGLLILLSTADVLLNRLFDLGNNQSSEVDSVFPRHRLYVFLMIGYVLFALGEPIFIGSSKIMVVNPFLHILGPIPDTFRSTGRFLWPVVYSLLIWSFCRIMRLKWRSYSLKNISLFLFLVMLSESAMPVADKIHNIMSARINSSNVLTDSQFASELTPYIRGADYFINSTGQPDLTLDQMPKFFLQNINPKIKTNYNPYLARMPKGFVNFYSRDACQIFRETHVQAKESEGAAPEMLYLLSSSDVKRCDIGNRVDLLYDDLDGDFIIAKLRKS